MATTANTRLTRGRTRTSTGAGGAVKAGLVGGALAGMMMGLWQMVVGSVADEPTAVQGIETSFWTPMTAIPSVLFGLDWFHEDFEFWPVVLGIAGHMMNAMVLGVIGVAIIVGVAGRRPRPGAALAAGLAYGLVLEVVMVNLIVNSIQEPNALYTSTPRWSWWAAHAIFGVVLALVAVPLLERRYGRGGR